MWYCCAVVHAMRIGGVQWTSIVDYPDRLATTVFTVACDLRCPFCQNRSLVIPAEYPAEDMYPVERVVRKLVARRKYIGAVVITGGEPTLQQDLGGFCHRMKEAGFVVKLDTNGTHPKVLRQLLEDEVLDYVAMDYKAPLTRYPKVTVSKIDPGCILESLEVLTDPQGVVPVEFRTTVAAPLVTLDDVRKIARDLEARKAQRYFLQQAQQPDHLLVDPTFKLEPLPTTVLTTFVDNELRPRFRETGIRGIA